MLLAIGAMLPLIVLVVRMLMRGLIAIMTLGIALEIRANPRYARGRTDGPVEHRQTKQHDDDLRAHWVNDVHKSEYSTCLPQPAGAAPPKSDNSRSSSSPSRLRSGILEGTARILGCKPAHYLSLGAGARTARGMLQCFSSLLHRDAACSHQMS